MVDTHILTENINMTKPPKQTDYPVHELIASRWSGRAFADRDVEESKIKSLFEAARWASSSYNEQPWHFIITRKGESSHEKLFNTLMSGNQAWAGEAPILILTIAKVTLSRNEKPNNYARHDLGLAMGQFSLQATELGLNLHQMAGFDKTAAKELFNLPETFEPVTVVALGYLGDPKTLPENYQKSEQAKQTRKKIGEFVFQGEWGNPYE